MRKAARTTGERGFSTLELTMAMPLVVFAMLLLIGLGHALISKQHAVVGGQLAAHHQRVRNAVPNGTDVGRAGTRGAEDFARSGGGDQTINYTAEATAQKGLIAQTYPRKATSQYQIPRITNACVPNCKPFDTFASILSPQMITGMIFSGNSGALSADNLLSIVSGKGKKQLGQRPPGAAAMSPGRQGSGSGGPLLAAVGETGPSGGRRSLSDQERIAAQRRRRNERRNRQRGIAVGQNPGARKKKGPSGDRPEGPDTRDGR